MKKTKDSSLHFDSRYRLARQIIHLRIYIILACIIISVFFISVLKDIEIETRLEDFLPQQHPFIQVQNILTDVFGGLNQVSIALKSTDGNIFTHDFLEKVISLTEDVYLLEGVNISRVQSIASRHVKHVRADEEGFFVERLLRDPPENQEEMEAFRRNVLSDPNVYRRMVSEDMTSTLIYVDFTSKVRTSSIFRSLQELKTKYEDEHTYFYIAGRPILEGWLNAYLPKMLRILIISFLIISAVLYLTFRSKRGIILPLLDSSMATLWGMGTMKLMGLRLDPSTILVPFIVLSLGISHSVHTLKRYYEEMRNPRMKSKHAIVSTMAHLFIPGLACVLTDGFGFLSLMFVPLPTIKSMAFASGLGILANFFTSFMFTPAVLSFMHRPKILEIEKEEEHRWVDAMLLRLSVFSLSKRAGTIVVVIFILGGLVALLGISRIVIGDNSQGSSYLYPESPYNQAEKFINTHFGGTNSYYVLVESDRPLFSREVLSTIDDFQTYLVDNIPEVGSAVSIANAIKGLNMFMKEGKREYFAIPENDKTIAEYWFLYTLSGFPSDFDHLISRDEKTANIKFNVKNHTSRTVAKIIKTTRNYVSGRPQGTVRIRYGGGDIGILYAVNDIIKRTIVPNVLFISVLIFIYVSFMYRSFTAAGLLLLPLAFSNLIVFALYGFLGTPITVETLPLASLSEGLGINYGIYMMARFHQEMREKKRTYKNILYHTLITSGKAVFFSGFIVSLGIFAWVFSSILLQVRLGLNLCVALILNMVTSLVMIPVLVWWVKPYFLFGKVRSRLKYRDSDRGKKVSKG
ncbi:MAG: MMPL family transporter [Candidatus Omnitrophica bacterium]|nr:MMPL family transporter [Candidatus Omnitrophota bacterium]